MLRHTLRTSYDGTFKKAPQWTLQDHTDRWQPKAILSQSSDLKKIRDSRGCDQ